MNKKSRCEDDFKVQAYASCAYGLWVAAIQAFACIHGDDCLWNAKGCCVHCGKGIACGDLM